MGPAKPPGGGPNPPPKVPPKGAPTADGDPNGPDQPANPPALISPVAGPVAPNPPGEKLSQMGPPDDIAVGVASIEMEGKGTAAERGFESGATEGYPSIEARGIGSGLNTGGLENLGISSSEGELAKAGRKDEDGGVSLAVLPRPKSDLGGGGG